MRSIVLFIVAISVLVSPPPTVGGGAARASIPDSSGTIHACYKAAGGDLRVIDGATSHCLPSEVPLQWSQSGSATEAYLASNGGNQLHYDAVVVSLTLPPGKYTLIAKTGVYSLQDDDIVDCLLMVGSNIVDEDVVRINGFNVINDDNEFMDLIGTASLTDSTTVSLTCSASGTNTWTENAQLLATKVQTLH